MIHSSTARKSSLTDFFVDTTAMVDMMFILTFFFMLTAQSLPFGMEVNLPQTGTKAMEQKEKQITLSIPNNANEWLIDGTPYQDFGGAKAAILSRIQAQPGLQVIIAGDSKAPIEKLYQAMVFLSENNIPTASILMESEGR